MLLLVVAVSVSVVCALPSRQELLQSERQAKSAADYMIPPPNSPESEAKANAFVDAYHAYIDSLGKKKT